MSYIDTFNVMREQLTTIPNTFINSKVTFTSSKFEDISRYPEFMFHIFSKLKDIEFEDISEIGLHLKFDIHSNYYLKLEMTSPYYIILSRYTTSR